MIGDVLSDAVARIDQYLEMHPRIYAGEIRRRIIDIRNQMEIVRAELDRLPPQALIEREAQP